MFKMIAMAAATGMMLTAGTASAGITLASTPGVNYPTIQAAVNQAALNPQNADTISLTAGTYAGFNVGNHPFANLTIAGPTWNHGPGVFPPAEITGGAVVVSTAGTLPAGPTVTLSQLGIKYGSVGVYVTDNSTVTLDNCNVYKNSEHGVEQDSGTLIVKRGYIAGNRGPSYPGVFNTGGTISLQSDAQICGNTNDWITPLPPIQQVRDLALVSPVAGVVQNCHINGLTDMNYDMVHSLEDVYRLRADLHGICHYDNDGDGDTDIDDLLNLIEGWGTSCSP